MKTRLLLGICALLLCGALGCKNDKAYQELTSHRAAGDQAKPLASGASGTEAVQGDTSGNTSGDSSGDDTSVEDQASIDRRAAARKSLGL